MEKRKKRRSPGGGEGKGEEEEAERQKKRSPTGAKGVELREKKSFGLTGDYDLPRITCTREAKGLWN